MYFTGGGHLRSSGQTPTEDTSTSDTNDFLSDLISSAAEASRIDTTEEFVSAMRSMTAAIDAGRQPSPLPSHADSEELSLSSARLASAPSYHHDSSSVHRGRMHGITALSKRKPSPMPGPYSDFRESSAGRLTSPSVTRDTTHDSHGDGIDTRSHSVPYRGSRASDSPSPIFDESDSIHFGSMSELAQRKPVISLIEDSDVRDLLGTEEGRLDNDDDFSVTTGDLQIAAPRRRSSFDPGSRSRRSSSLRSLDGVHRSPSPGVHLTKDNRPGTAPARARRGTSYTGDSSGLAVPGDVSSVDDGETSGQHGSVSDSGADKQFVRTLPAGMVRESMLATLNGVEPRANMRLPSVSVFPLSYAPLELSERSEVKRDRIVAQIVQRQRQAQLQVTKLADGMQAVLVRDLKILQDAHYREESQAQAHVRNTARAASKSKHEVEAEAEAQHKHLHSVNVRERQQRSNDGMLKCVAFLLRRLDSLKDLQLHNLKQLYEWDQRYLDKLLNLRIASLEEEQARLEKATPQHPQADKDRRRRSVGLRGLLGMGRRSLSSPAKPATIAEVNDHEVAAVPLSDEQLLNQALKRIEHKIAEARMEVDALRQAAETAMDAERTNVLQFYLDQGNRLFAMKQALLSTASVKASFV